MGFVLTHPASSGGATGGSGVPGLVVTMINGQNVLTLEDTTRSNKILSVSDNPLTFSENVLADNDWLAIGTATDADSGFISSLDGTIVAISAHCENTLGNEKDIHLFIDGVDLGSLGTLSGGLNATINDTTIDIDVNQGQRIRLRALNGSGGNIRDTVVTLRLKWRGI